ncbi:nuclear transport factor 2 family protein [Neptuniibacter sp.]|uniref:nuclear transport factor 2 family protein n=1 Tax=Neptuniibacter sp. TaxID=1962643 RepID=UPI002630FCBD|nr:nuclear transport factor 2 family protein [Neptuniibacter sp.]MCP4595990.1 nuclear transport factor 2 family protein [Neptuniibacter sp.]
MGNNTLKDIEEIKKLKAKYFRLMDRKLWKEWGELFTEDVVAVYHGPHPEIRYEGRLDMVRQVSTAIGDAVTVHHGHMPDIELTSSTTATGTWAMFDYVRKRESCLKGYGYYEEDYFKENGKWKIKRLLLTRLHVDFVPISAGT